MANNRSRQRRWNILLTPAKGIPIGEPTVTESGKLALRFKKPDKNEYETVTIDALNAMVGSTIETMSQQTIRT